MTGLDATVLFLDRARRDAASRSVDVDHFEGDMRLWPWTDERFLSVRQSESESRCQRVTDDCSS
jgi:hypothetical protein